VLLASRSEESEAKMIWWFLYPLRGYVSFYNLLRRLRTLSYMSSVNANPATAQPVPPSSIPSIQSGMPLPRPVLLRHDIPS
jgi:hypothetical protein